ncbi:Jag family protein [Tomitella gaofuii]|uniref:Jag family protein n=1 Tax=Tomitella gaofuii TaxID=2760083 RepID=UPI0015FD413C
MTKPPRTGHETRRDHVAHDDLLQPEGAQAEDQQSDTPAEADTAAEQSTDEQDGSGLSGEELLVEEGEIAGDYLEQLLDVLDYDGDIDMDVEGRRAVVSVDGGRDLGRLVGQSGDVLDALQELTRLAVQQQTGVRSRLMLDVAGWRAGKRTELTRLGTTVAERVKDSGEREELKPMTPFERKIVHDAVASVDGVYSESVGTDSSRRVVVLPE